MNHLSPDDLIDALEGEVASRVTAHLAACDRCRREAEDLRATRAAVADVDVPDPSPLFWSRHAARVVDATRAAVPAPFGWWRQPWLRTRWTWSLAAAALCAFALVGSVVLRPGPVVPPASGNPVADSPLAVSDTGSSDDEAPWALIADLSEDIDWDAVSAAGLGPMPGSAERLVSQLSDAERAELAKLLALELAGSSL